MSFIKSYTSITPQTIEQFALDLEQKRIVCHKNGWKEQGRIASYIQRLWEYLPGKRDARDIAIGQCFAAAISQLERVPVLFGGEGGGSQSKCYANYIKAGECIAQRLKTSKSSQAINYLNEINMKVAAMKYRIEGCHGGLDRDLSLDNTLYTQVQELVLNWKKGEKLFNIEDLTQKDIEKIKQIVYYPKFAELLLSNKELKQEFFKWTFRDNNGVDQFVQFPTLCSWVKNNYISSRVGYFGGEGLSIANIPSSEASVTQKVLQLPFYNGSTTEKISILDESRKVTLNGDWTLSIKEIFDRFANKEQNPRHIEYVSTKGIMNWNAMEQGFWNPRTETLTPVDLNDPNWLKQLPVHIVKSREKIFEEHGVELGKEDWLLLYRATRESPDLSPKGCHGYLEVIIPLEEGGYAAYPFGKYAERVPDNLFGFLKFVDNTVQAKLCYPDENIYYSQRQQAFSAEKLSAIEGQKLLELIRHDLLQASQKNIVFQMRNDNCASWVEDLARRLHQDESTYPSKQLYKINLVDLNVFAPLRNFSKKMQITILKTLDFVLGSRRGLSVVENGKKVTRSVDQISDNERGMIYHPGNLHALIERKVLPGKIYMGHR